MLSFQPALTLKIVLEENEYDNEPPLALYVVRDYGRAEFPAEHLPGFDRDRAGKGSFNHFAGKEQAIWGLWTATNALDWVFAVRDHRCRGGHGPGIDPGLTNGN